MAFNESKKEGINKSQNPLPIKGWDNYNTLDLNNNGHYDKSYKKYIDSSIDRNNDIYIDPQKETLII